MERTVYDDTVEAIHRPCHGDHTVITRDGKQFNIDPDGTRIDGPWEFSGIPVTVAAVLHHFGRTPSVNPVMTYPRTSGASFTPRVSYEFKSRNSGYRLVVYGLPTGVLDYTGNGDGGLLGSCRASRLTAMRAGQDFIITTCLEAEDQWGAVTEFNHFQFIQVIPRKCNKYGLPLKFRLSTSGKIVRYSDLYDHCLGIRRCNYLTRIDDVEDPTYLGF